MRLAVITCYNQPNYIRTKSLLAALRCIDAVEVIDIRNRRIGLLRYPEVFLKILRARINQRPDAYLLAFRGYEMLLPVRLLTLGKPLAYDEFINPIEWVVKEKRQVEAKQTSAALYRTLVAMMSRIIVAVVASRLFKWIYRRMVQSTGIVLTDTNSHADISAELTGARRSIFLDVPVGADESVIEKQGERVENDVFTVIYYGSMLPLHGLQYVIDAAVKMNHDNVKFVVIGGNAKVAHDVAYAVGNGANIDYKAWVEFDQLPKLIEQADLCLAGPFGNTFQARYVITGKAYQYLAMGKPTIIGINEESHIFTDKKDALLIPQADSDALVDAIRWAIDHPTELDKIGTAGKSLYENELSVAVIAGRLKEMLLKLGLTEPATGNQK